MQKEVGGKNMRPRGVPSVKGQLAAAVFTWLLQLHLHPEYQGSVQKQKLKSAQLCLTLHDPTDYTVHGIIQASILEWAAFPFSRDLPNPGIEPRSPTLQVDSLPAEPLRSRGR